MLTRYYFKDDDLIPFLKTYIWAIRFERSYQDLSYSTKHQHRKEYANAINVIDAYNEFYQCLKPNEQEVVSSYVSKSRKLKLDYLPIYKRLSFVFKITVLSRKCFKIKDIDIKKLGSWLKEKRVNNGYPRVHAAAYLGISEASLRAYEEGRRTIRIDVFYRMLLLYSVDEIDLFDF